MSQTSDETQSPCRNICVMDHARGFCTGCGRTISEITHWLGYPPEARRAINAAARERLAGSTHSALKPLRS